MTNAREPMIPADAVFGEAIATTATILLAMVQRLDTKHDEQMSLSFSYVNHRGDKRIRKVSPFRVKYGATEWHPKPQLLLEGYCHDAMATRDFAVADIDITSLAIIY